MTKLQAPRKSSKSKPELTVSLCLAINHVPYIVTPIKAYFPEIIVAWRLEKQGADGATYDIAATTNGHVCDCPDFETRRKGLDSSGCKHIKAAVQTGLLSPPVPPMNDKVTDEATVPCCDPATESLPCLDCQIRDLPPGPGAEPVAELAPVDPWDVESDPETWDALTDEHVWSVTVADEGPHDDGSEDHLLNSAPESYEPSDSDRAELAEVYSELEARDYLDRSATLKLDALVDHVSGFFTGWKTDAGDLIAKTLAELAFKIRYTGAETPSDFEARIEVLDAEIRYQWAESGRDSARDAAECFGHSA